MSLLQQPQIKGIGPTTLGNPFSQFMAPTAPEPVVPNITPRKSPVDLTSQGATMPTAPVTQAKLPQGIPEPKLQPTYANDPFEDKKNGITRDQFGQTQAKPGTLGSFDPNDLIQGIQDVGKSIQGTTNEVGDFFQNKAPGLEKAKQEGRFLTQDHLTSKITSAIQSMPDATDEEIAHAIGQLKNEGYIFEGMNDKNFDNPVTNFLGNTPLGAGTDLLGGATKMAGNFVGGTLEGGAQMSEGMVDVLSGDKKGYADVAEGATKYGMNMLGGAFPGVSSVFNTEAIKPVTENTLTPLHEGIQKNIVNKGLDLTGMDPNSEEYQKYSIALSDVTTLLTTMGIFKTGEIGFRETFGTNLNYNNSTVGDFVKNTGKTAKDLSSAIKQAKPDFKGNVKESTPISKIFTPEEYAQMEAIARNNGATGTPRREGIISDATQAKVKEKITNGLNMAKKRTSESTPISGENAINSQGIKGTVPEPTVLTNIKDKVFGDAKDIDLANRAVSPRNVKGKTMSDKMKSGEVALAGIQQLHDDSIAGNINADIGTIEGGIAGIEEARQHYGKIIGENASPNEKIQATDIGEALKTELQNPIMVISGPIKGIGDDLVKMLNHESFQDGITMKDVQTTLSTISNRIRNSPELRNSLQSEPAGQAVSAFIDELSRRYEKAVEEGGNGTADKQARQAYAKYMKIQNDLLNSGMVNARNTRSGQAGFVGKSIATYELLTHGVSGIPVALAMKYLGETKGEYATRGGAYEKLIRNMDRKALQRTKGVYNTGDTSKYNPKPTPKTAKPTPKTKSNVGTNVNSSSVPTDTVDMAGTEGKPTPRSDIPGAKRTKIEVPGNPKGNISNKLAGNKGVIVPKEKVVGPTKLLPSGDRARQAEVKDIERSLNTALLSKNISNKTDYVKTFIDKRINDGLISKDEGIAIVEKLYENANGFDKPHYEKILNELFTKKTVSFDDLLNEKPDNKPTISPRQEYLESPKGMYEKFRKMSADGRYNHSTTDAFMEKFKEKTGWDLMKDGDPVFDADGQIVKPKSKKNESKVSKPTAGDTIPDGYTTNAFGEVIKKPGNAKGGFIKIPEIGKKEVQDLAVLHNLSLEKVKKINEIGGMPGPSLAITKKNIPFEDFGDITLVGDKDLIQSMKAKTYSADIYSPRVPQPDIIYKNPKIVAEISKKTGIDEWKVDSDIKDGYFTEKEEYKPYIEDIENSIDKKLFKGYTYSGNRKYSAYNLDNVIKEMFSKGNKGAESSIFAGNLSQTMGKEAKALTIPQIKKSSFGSSPELDAKYQSLKDEWADIVGWDGASAINESFTSKGNPETILKNIHQYSDGEKFTLSDIKRLQEIATEATNLPKTYLETKIQRGVQLNEFRGVIAPEEQIPELKKLLKGTGLEDKIVGYKKGESRSSKLQDLQDKYGNIFFNIGGAFIGLNLLMQFLSGNDEKDKIDIGIKPRSEIKRTDITPKIKPRT